MAQGAGTGRLAGWASIGGYIGRDARTAQRYEQERGLPVRRMPGSGRSTVFALRVELDAWLLAQGSKTTGETAGTSAVAPPAVAEPAPQPAEPLSPFDSAGPRGTLTTALGALKVRRLAAAAAAGVLLAAGGLWIGHGTRAAPVEKRSAFDDRAAAAFSERSPGGLMRAIDDYTQAVVSDPKDAAAFAGLADSYNLAPEVMGMTPLEAFPKARAAAERAIALDPKSAAAHRALAFALFWWGQDVKGADEEFRRALKLDPQSALTHHWYANALAAQGDKRALGEIDQALALEPSAALLVDKGWVLAMLGRNGEAADWVSDAIRMRPDLASAHIQLALLKRWAGDTPGELAEKARAAELTGATRDAQALRAAAATYASQGRAATLRQLDEQGREALAQGRGSAFASAITASDLRDRAATLRFLAAARQAREPAVMSLRINPDFAWLRSDTNFQKLLPT